MTPSARSTACSRWRSELGPAEKPPRAAVRTGVAQSTMPLIEIARTKTKPEALEVLERGRARIRRWRGCCIPPTT